MLRATVCVLIVAAFFSMGCSSSESGGGGGQDAGGAGGGGAGGSGAGGSGAGGSGAGPSTGTIGPEGGVVEAEGARLTVPAGAVTEPVSFTISKVSSPPLPQNLTPAGAMIEVLPAGLTLAVPAELVLTFSMDANPTGVVTVYTAPSGGSATDFTLLPSVVQDATHVAVQVDHFSFFAPFFESSQSTSCPQGGCPGGYQCVNCSFPVCMPGGTICCDFQTCVPPANRCLVCDGEPFCVEDPNAVCCAGQPCEAPLVCGSCSGSPCCTGQ